MFSQKGLQFCRCVRQLCTAAEGKTRLVFTGERSVNKVTLIGRVGRKPEMRGTEERPVVLVSLATSQSFQSGDGEYNQQTEWHRIAIFRPGLRDLILNTIDKGDRLYISGMIRYRNLKVSDDVAPVKTASIIADEVIVLARRNRAGEYEEDETSQEQEAESAI